MSLKAFWIARMKVHWTKNATHHTKGTTMSLIKIEPALKDMFHSLGSDPETEAVKIFNMGLKEILRKCEEEILKLEIKYGMSYEEFKLELDSGELGDPFSYPLEKDTMLWEDLMAEKRIRLKIIRQVEERL